MLKPRGNTTDPLLVSSIKAISGHAEPAAGSSGLLRLATGLASAESPPNAQLRVINEHVESALKGLSAALPTQLGGLLRAPDRSGYVGGVSSFGYSGTIVHTVLESTPALTTAKGATAELGYVRKRYTWRETPHPLIQRRATDGRVCCTASSSGRSPLLVPPNLSFPYLVSRTTRC